jgi:hypothetical protein
VNVSASSPLLSLFIALLIGSSGLAYVSSVRNCVVVWPDVPASSMQPRWGYRLSRSDMPSQIGPIVVGYGDSQGCRFGGSEFNK